MTTKLPRNKSGLTLREWFRAAGWECMFDERVSPSRHGKTFNQLAAAWSKDQDPSEWLSTAPKSVHDLIASQPPRYQ